MRKSMCCMNTISFFVSYPSRTFWDSELILQGSGRQQILAANIKVKGNCLPFSFLNIAQAHNKELQWLWNKAWSGAQGHGSAGRSLIHCRHFASNSTGSYNEPILGSSRTPFQDYLRGRWIQCRCLPLMSSGNAPRLPCDVWEKGDYYTQFLCNISNRS